jgi:hypothetical protein
MSYEIKEEGYEYGGFKLGQMTNYGEVVIADGGLIMAGGVCGCSGAFSRFWSPLAAWWGLSCSCVVACCGSGAGVAV